jgi:hypothetical protein
MVRWYRSVNVFDTWRTTMERLSFMPHPRSVVRLWSEDGETENVVE